MGGGVITASLEMMASSPGCTPCFTNSRAAYPCNSIAVRLRDPEIRRRGYHQKLQKKESARARTYPRDPAAEDDVLEVLLRRHGLSGVRAIDRRRRWSGAG
jgi:hypothetical protein